MDTDRCPPNHDEDTDRHGLRPTDPPPTDMLPDRLLVRLTEGVEHLSRTIQATTREVIALRKDIQLTLQEGRLHGQRITALEQRIGTLRCQVEDCLGE